MQLIIDQCQNIIVGGPQDADAATSETALILRQFSRRSDIE
jgi:hypothetical protein